MSNASGRGAASHRDNLPSIRWRSWPLADDLLRTMIVVVGLVVAWVVVRWVTGQTAMAVIALVALAISLWRFFLPVSYELSVEGVDQWFFGHKRRIPWKTVRRYEIRPAGVLLLPRSERCPMDVFRGLYLPWGNRREEILAQLHSYLGESDEG